MSIHIAHHPPCIGSVGVGWFFSVTSFKKTGFVIFAFGPLPFQCRPTLRLRSARTCVLSIILMTNCSSPLPNAFDTLWCSHTSDPSHQLPPLARPAAALLAASGFFFLSISPRGFPASLKVSISCGVYAS